MKRLQKNTLSRIVIAASFGLGSAFSATATVPDFETSLQVRLDEDHQVVAILHFKNQGSATAYLASPVLYSARFAQDYFSIHDCEGGDPIPFSQPHVNHDPSDTQFRPVAAGETVSTQAVLTNLYDFSALDPNQPICYDFNGINWSTPASLANQPTIGLSATYKIEFENNNMFAKTDPAKRGAIRAIASTLGVRSPAVVWVLGFLVTTALGFLGFQASRKHHS